MTTPNDLPFQRKSPIALGHNHSTKEIKTVGECKRCDYVRGRVALETPGLGFEHRVEARAKYILLALGAELP